MRDESLSSVLAKNAVWKIRAIRAMPRYKGREMTGEEIRLELEQRGLVPHHHNAWGALIMDLVRKGILIDTGRVTHMVTRRSHARRTPIWRVQ